MRGVVCGGMVSALEVLGLRNVFDAVYGSSSGAMAGAYFLAGQARFGTTIYYQCINNSRFINKLNILFSKSIMNTNFLLDHVCTTVRPLLAQLVVTSDIPLYVIASSLGHNRSIALSSFADENELFEALRCSINVPGIAGDPIRFRDDLLLDAALYEAIPFRSAKSQGATHALVLLTRPSGQTKETRALFQRVLWRYLLRDQPAAVVSEYIDRPERYQQELEEVRSAEKGEISNISAQCISVHHQYQCISPLETRSKVLLSGAFAGFQSVFETLDVNDVISAQVLGAECSLSGNWREEPRTCIERRKQE